MARPGKIREPHEADIIQLAGEGKSTREIAAALTTKHGLQIGHVAVARWLSERRAERAEVSRGVAREELSKTVTADVRRLDNIAIDAMKVAIAVRNAALGDDGALKDLSAAEAYPKVAAAAIKATEAKLKAAGVDEPDDASALAEAERRLSSDLAGIAARLGKSSNPS
jgi:hypothetical protein